MLLAPLLTEHLPGRLDARARGHVRSVEEDAACQNLQRLAALHTSLVQAAADSDLDGLRRSAEIGHNLLWGAADLLQNQDAHTASTRLAEGRRLGEGRHRSRAARPYREVRRWASPPSPAPSSSPARTVTCAPSTRSSPASYPNRISGRAMDCCPRSSNRHETTNLVGCIEQ